MLRFRSDILFVWYHLRSTPEIAALTAYFAHAPSCLQVLRADALVRRIAAFAAGGAHSTDLSAPLRRDIASIPELVAAIFDHDQLMLWDIDRQHYLDFFLGPLRTTRHTWEALYEDYPGTFRHSSHSPALLRLAIDTTTPNAGDTRTLLRADQWQAMLNASIHPAQWRKLMQDIVHVGHATVGLHRSSTAPNAPIGVPTIDELDPITLDHPEFMFERQLGTDHFAITAVAAQLCRRLRHDTTFDSRSGQTPLRRGVPPPYIQAAALTFSHEEAWTHVGPAHNLRMPGWLITPSMALRWNLFNPASQGLDMILRQPPNIPPLPDASSDEDDGGEADADAANDSSPDDSSDGGSSSQGYSDDDFSDHDDTFGEDGDDDDADFSAPDNGFSTDDHYDASSGEDDDVDPSDEDDDAPGGTERTHHPTDGSDADISDDEDAGAATLPVGFLPHWVTPNNVGAYAAYITQIQVFGPIPSVINTALAHGVPAHVVEHTLSEADTMSSSDSSDEQSMPDLLQSSDDESESEHEHGPDDTSRYIDETPRVPQATRSVSFPIFDSGWTHPAPPGPIMSAAGQIICTIDNRARFEALLLRVFPEWTSSQTARCIANTTTLEALNTFAELHRNHWISDDELEEEVLRHVTSRHDFEFLNSHVAHLEFADDVVFSAHSGERGTVGFARPIVVSRSNATGYMTYSRSSTSEDIHLFSDASWPSNTGHTNCTFLATDHVPIVISPLTNFRIQYPIYEPAHHMPYSMAVVRHRFDLQMRNLHRDHFGLRASPDLFATFAREIRDLPSRELYESVPFNHLGQVRIPIQFRIKDRTRRTVVATHRARGALQIIVDDEVKSAKDDGLSSALLLESDPCCKPIRISRDNHEDDDPSASGLTCLTSDTHVPASVGPQDVPDTFAPAPLSPFMKLSAGTSRLIEFDEESQSYICSFPASRLVDFLTCYNVTAGRQFKDVIIHLVDSGASTGLSPMKAHFFIEISCDETIAGIGDRQVQAYAPLIFSMLATKSGEQSPSTHYVTFQLRRTYKLTSLGFPLFPTGPAEQQGYIFVLSHNHPHIIGPNGIRAPLIKDYTTGLTWICERVYAKPTVIIKRGILEEYAGDPDVIRRRPDLIGDPETKPDHVDTKERYDARLRATSHMTVDSFYRALSSDEALEFAKVGREQRTPKGASAPERRSKRLAGRAPAGEPSLEWSDDEGLQRDQHGSSTSTGRQAMTPSDDASTKPSTKVDAATNKAGEDPEGAPNGPDDLLLRKTQSCRVAKRPRANLRLPVLRFLDNGEPHAIQNFKEWFHQSCIHLQTKSLFDVIRFCDDAEIASAVKRLDDASPGQPLDGHCEACALYKSKLHPTPGQRTAPDIIARPREEAVYLDPCGKVEEASIFHGFHYYIAAITKKGYIMVYGMTYRSQSLFVIARLFNDLGGAPKHTYVDGAGELTSEVAQQYFAHANTSFNKTEASEHWRLGKPERAHGSLKGATNACLHHANAPLKFWYLALSHVALLLNVLRRARTYNSDDEGKQLDQTVYEAHHGSRPSFSTLVVGPFGCLAFVVLAAEQRQARHLDKNWAPKAISGMFMGIWHNPRKRIFHYLMFDGSKILETTSNIRIIGDCFPWKLQRGRDLPLNISADSDPDDDDFTEAEAPPCAHCGRSSSTTIYACAMANQTRADKLLAQNQLAFCSTFDPTQGSRFSAAYSADRKSDLQKHRNDSRLPKKSLQRSIINPPTHGPTDVFEAAGKPDDEVPLDDPRTYTVTEAPPLFRFVPSPSGCFNTAEIPNFADDAQVPAAARHPHNRYVGRRVRKMFPEFGTSPFEGTVKRFSSHHGRNLFRIDYDDGDDEDMDIAQLLEHIIMSSDHGDQLRYQGLTRWEINESETQQAIVFAALEEAADHISDSQDSDTRYCRHAHVSTSLDGRFVRPSTPDPSPRKPAIRLSPPDPSLRHPERRHPHFKDAPQVHQVYYTDAERRAKQDMMACISVDLHRPDFGPCINKPDCECATCQYFWTIEGGRVIWDDVRASRFQSASNAQLGQGPYTKNKTDLEIELLRRMQAHQGLETTPTPTQSPEETDWTPQNWPEVERHPQADLIRASARSEMLQIRSTGTGRPATPQELQDLHASGQKILPAKMVYKLKYHTEVLPDGTRRDVPDKWKARLAAVGSREQPGLDFAESTFSPTVGMTAIRTLVSICCDTKLDLRSYDLSGAYLGTPLARPVFIRLPADAEDDRGTILRCEKAIYGLRDSSAAFCRYLGEQVQSFRHNGFRFRQHNMEQCLYVYEDDQGNRMYFCHYVDDLAIATTCPKLREELLAHINKTWKITDEGVLQRFIGINFWRSDNRSSWHMSLAPYIDKMAKRFHIDPAARSDVPIDPGFVLTPSDLEEPPTPEMISEFRSLIGSIGFAATSVRFDIAYAVSVLSRHLARPCHKVINEAKRCIKYLLKTRDFTVTWSLDPTVTAADMRNVLWAAADASYAADPITRRSHGGYITYLNGGPISWKSGLQKLVCLSSAESEFVALTSCIVEVRYLRMLLDGLHLPQTAPTTVLEDNRAAIIIAEGTVSGGGRAKHIDVRYKHAAESVRNGICTIRYIASAWNFADILTKPLAPTKFQTMRLLCITPSSRPADSVAASTDLNDRLAACHYTESASAFFLLCFGFD